MLIRMDAESRRGDRSTRRRRLLSGCRNPKPVVLEYWGSPAIVQGDELVMKSKPKGVIAGVKCLAESSRTLLSWPAAGQQGLHNDRPGVDKFPKLGSGKVRME